MEFSDKILKCAECGAEFVFTAGEQVFFASKDFKNEPKRCKPCKAKRAGNKQGPIFTETICSDCGAQTIVPFVPTQGKAVRCRPCHEQARKVAQ